MSTEIPWRDDTDKLAEFHAKHERSGPDDCWPWTGPGEPYGSMYWPAHGGTGAHRIAFQLFHERLAAPGMDVDHTCTNKMCVNPQHLAETTRAENVSLARQREKAAGKDFHRPRGAPVAALVDPEALYTLGDPVLLAATGMTGSKSLMVARNRSRDRIARGARETPFPEPVRKIGGSRVYRGTEVVEWHKAHCDRNNPSRARWRDATSEPADTIATDTARGARS